MKKNKVLSGTFDSQQIAEVETLNDTFSITVSDKEGEVRYTNKEEPYSYSKVPSLQTALEFFGAKLTDDQKNFLTEALSGGEDTGKAVLKIVETINDNLKADAKASQYAKISNQHKVVTEEMKDNAYARIIRNVMKTSEISDETCIERLQIAGVIPKEYTLAEFRANKSKV